MQGFIDQSEKKSIRKKMRRSWWMENWWMPGKFKWKVDWNLPGKKETTIGTSGNSCAESLIWSKERIKPIKQYERLSNDGESWWNGREFQQETWTELTILKVARHYIKKKVSRKEWWISIEGKNGTKPETCNLLFGDNMFHSVICWFDEGDCQIQKASKYIYLPKPVLTNPMLFEVGN